MKLTGPYSTVPFHAPHAKAVTTPLDTGDMLIEAWALRFDEVADREDEAWSENGGLIVRAIERFVRGNAPVCAHHDYRTVLGKCLDYEHVPGVGIKMRARIDFQPPGSPWRHFYDAIRRGSIAQVSLGGRFKKAVSRLGAKIVDADFLELSVCGTSVGRETSFRIIQQKALSAPAGKAVTSSGLLVPAHEYDTADLRDEINRLALDAADLRTRRLLGALSR